jgi:hypothetical protein
MSIRLILLIVVPAIAGGASFAIRQWVRQRRGEDVAEKVGVDSENLSTVEALTGSLSVFELYCLGLAGLGLLLGVAKGVFYLFV